MAIASNTIYFLDGIVSSRELGDDIDIFRSDTSPKYPVGTSFTRADGNRYRYCQFGYLTAAGKLVSTDVSESFKYKTENVGCDKTRMKDVATGKYTNEVGSYLVQLGITSVTLDQYAGGYLVVTTGSGTGYTYRIKGNDVTGTQVANNTILTLYDPIVDAIGTDSDITITGCPYSNVEEATLTDPVVMGVSVTGNSTGSYGWICEHGITGVLSQAVDSSFSGLCPFFLGTDTAGSISVHAEPASSGNALAYSPRFGTVFRAGTATDYHVVYLNMSAVTC